MTLEISSNSSEPFKSDGLFNQSPVCQNLLTSNDINRKVNPLKIRLLKEFENKVFSMMEKMQLVCGKGVVFTEKKIKPLFLHKDYWDSEIFDATSSLERCFTSESREKYIVDVGNDNKKNFHFSRNGDIFSTMDLITERSGKGYAIFVIGQDLKLYINSHKRKVFQHSSFFAGGVVAAAGEIKIDENGRLVSISNRSGHYRPKGLDNMYVLEFFLEKLGEEALKEVQFFEYDKDQVVSEKSALDHLNDLREAEKEEPDLSVEKDLENQIKNLIARIQGAVASIL